MVNLMRYCILGSFTSSVLSVIFIITSLASKYWVTARMQIRGGNPVDDTVNYGLYGGRFTVWNPGARTYPLYMVCANFNCALTCKTSREARRQDVINLSSGHFPESVECDNNVNIIPGRPLNRLPVIPVLIYATINILMYLQLIFATGAILLAVVTIFTPESKLIRGLHGIIVSSGVSALMGCIVLIVWGYFYSNTLRRHLAFAYVATQVLHVFPEIGYSYWLLIPAVILSLASVGLAFIRADYARKDVQPHAKC